MIIDRSPVVKFLPLITSIFFSIPFFALLSMHINDQNKEINYSKEEIDGLRPLEILNHVETAVSQYLVTPSATSRKNILNTLSQLRSEPITFAHLTQALEQLNDSGFSTSTDWFYEVFETIQDIRHQTMDEHAFVIDPDVNTYYVQNIIGRTLPEIKSRVRQLLMPVSQALNSYQLSELQSHLSQLESELEKAVNFDGHFHGLTLDTQKRTRELGIKFLDYSQLLTSKDVALQQKDIRSLYLQSRIEFENGLMTDLKNLMEIRLAALKSKMRIEVLFSLFLWFTGALITALLMRKISHSERLLEKQTQQMFAGEKLATLGTVTASVAHEVLNPITAIKFQLMDIKKELRLEPLNTNAIKLNVTKIDRIIDRTISTIRGLKQFARQDEVESIKKVFLPELIEDAITVTEPRLRQIKAEIKIDENFPQVYVDCRPGQIVHLLVNLIINAADAIEDLTNRWVRINAEFQENMIVIRVIDSGPGIAKELASKILTPFFTTKPSGKGLGLGLTICQKIAADHNGVLNINSDFANTCFEVRLPYA